MANEFIQGVPGVNSDVIIVIAHCKHCLEENVYCISQVSLKLCESEIVYLAAVIVVNTVSKAHESAISSML